MDKAYKPHFLRLCKVALRERFPQFEKVNLDRVNPDYDRYTGSFLLRMTVGQGRCVWLLIAPDQGVSRRFFARIGWSLKTELTPLGIVGNEALIDARLPISEVEGGWLDIEQIEGRNSVPGILIPSPWDQLLVLPFNVTKAKERQALLKCDLEAQALTAAQREEAVKTALDDALTRIQRHLLEFTQAVENLS